MELFLLAVSFFSRLPVPSDLPYSEERMNQAGRYFALVGVILGVLCALVFYFTQLIFPDSVALVLTMALLAKFVLWSELVHLPDFWLVIVVAYTTSRALAATLIYDMPYVSDSDTSKSKPLANKQSSSEVAILLFTAGVASLFLGVMQTSFIVIVLFAFRFAFKRWLTKRIGGFTGDCLGAAQQLSELLVYLTLIAFYQNI
ncbi:TPA: adenosylcobinamide-GDP ribazoletransferase [Vibrio parahaemolyticus]